MIPQWTDCPTDVERTEAHQFLASHYRYAQTVKRYPQNFPDWLVDEASNVPRRDGSEAIAVALMLVAVCAVILWRIAQ